MRYIILAVFISISVFLAGQSMQFGAIFDNFYQDVSSIIYSTDSFLNTSTSDSSSDSTGGSSTSASIDSSFSTNNTTTYVLPGISSTTSADVSVTDEPQTHLITSEILPYSQTQTTEIKTNLEIKTITPTIVPPPIIEKKDEVMPISAELNPRAKFKTPQSGGIKDITTIEFSVKNASLVEFNLRKSKSPASLYVGRGEKQGEDSWKFVWNTKSVPNAHYELYAAITNVSGPLYESQPIKIKVVNEVAIASENKKTVSDIKEQFEKKEKEVKEQNKTEKTSTTDAVIEKVNKFSKKIKTNITPQQVEKIEKIEKTAIPELKIKVEKYLETISDNVEVIKQEEIKHKSIEVLPTIEIKDEEKWQIKKDIEEKFKNEQEKKENTKKEMAQEVEKAKNMIASVLLESELPGIGPIKTEGAREVEQLIAQFEAKVEMQEEKKMSEVSSTIIQDSDKDGVSDYEEIFRFNTDPFAVDSDGDGFNDGVEIISGFNPLSISQEDKIVYENPKDPEVGIVQSQILKVEEIKVVEKVAFENGAENVKKIEIKGRALPNSFITIYIFSLPTIVTVKTDANGIWTYTFDKELEEGNHEIYVATTDNTGKIKAKSEPLLFTKQAGAISLASITPLESVVSEITPQTPSFWSASYLILTIFLTIFVIGIALFIIGFLLAKRERQ